MAKTYPPPLQPDLAVSIISRFLQAELKKTGFGRFVVGLSGGVDSALSCALAVHAVGPDRVVAVPMPYRLSDPRSERDAGAVASLLRVNVHRVDISPMVDAYFRGKEEPPPLRRGNFMARVRMAVLFDLSAREDALVLGTSNKTELLLGYGTWYGDMASSLNPIGDLYKTHVWQLGAHLGLPREVLEKPPSADLWQGQTDEGEMGLTYTEADAVLYLLVDERHTVEETATLSGLPRERVLSILARVEASQFKRRLPVIPKLTHRTVGIDFRYPRDWGR